MPTLREIAGRAAAAPSASGQTRLPSRRQQALTDYERAEEMNRRAAEQLLSSPEVLQTLLRDMESSVRGKTLSELAQDPEYLARLQAGQGQPELLRNLGGDILAAGQAFLPTYADFLTMGAGKAAAVMGGMPMAGPLVYHGTPHTFAPLPDNPLGAFNAAKIGTGEGAQAYGHGIYFAERPKVAESYKKRLAGASYVKDSQSVAYGEIWQQAADAAQEAGKVHPDYARAVSSQIMDWVDGGRKPETFLRYNRVPENAKPAYKAAIQQYAGLEKTKGNLYTADLPDEIVDQMLDWDKPLSQQPENVRLALADIGTIGQAEIKDGMALAGGGNLRIKDSDFGPRYFLEMGDSSFRLSESDVKNLIGSGNEGKSLYQSLSSKLGSDQKASEYLHSLGIPGIKYLDAGSRGQGGQATRNFVLFPGSEKYAKIVSRK